MRATSILFLAAIAAVALAKEPEFYDACYCRHPYKFDVESFDGATHTICNWIQRGTELKSNFLDPSKPLAYDPHYVAEARTDGHKINGLGYSTGIKWTTKTMTECILGHNNGFPKPEYEKYSLLYHLFVSHGACAADITDETMVKSTVQCVTVAASLLPFGLAETLFPSKAPVKKE